MANVIESAAFDAEKMLARYDVREQAVAVADANGADVYQVEAEQPTADGYVYFVVVR